MDPPPGTGRSGETVGGVLVRTATVFYTPNTPGFDPFDPGFLGDGFTFGVEDIDEAVSTAVVGVSPPDPSPDPPGLTDVDAFDFLVNPDPQDPTQVDAASTGVDIPVVIGLLAGAPESLSGVTFRIETGPTNGSLADSGGNDLTPPVDLPDSEVIYTPPSSPGISSFTYSARDSDSTTSPPCNEPDTSCDNATVEIDVGPAAPLAIDSTVTTQENQPVVVTLSLNPGGAGTPVGPPLRAGPRGINAALPIVATVAGGVADIPPTDGSGDVADTPTLVAAGVDVIGSGNPIGSVTDPTGDNVALTVPLRWVLQGVTFADGGTATGAFNYDATTESVTSWNITVAGGNTTSFPPLTYSTSNSTVLVGCTTGCPATQEKAIIITQNSSTRQFRITPDGAFTNLGGTLAVDLNTGGGGSGAVECFNCGPFRLINAGSLSAAGPQTSDLTSADLSSDGTDLSVDVRFAAATFEALFSGAFVYLDTDQNVATGCDIDDSLPCTAGASNDAVGWEYLVQIPKPQSGFNSTLTARVHHFSSVALSFDVPLTIESDGFTLSAPLASLGGDDGVLNFVVESFAHSGPQPSPGNATPNTTGIDYAPDLGSAGSTQGELEGTVRTQIEFDTSGVTSFSPDDEDKATVTLTTVKQASSTVSTQFFAGGSQPTPLTLVPSDFEDGASVMLPNVLMPVPAVANGTEGTFSFDVTTELPTLINGVFSIQGQVENESGLQGQGENQGLQIHTTTAGKEPLLVITTPAPPPAPPTLEILTLPSGGTLTTQAGAAVMVGATFPETTQLVVTPGPGIFGTISFTYQVTLAGIFDIATIQVIIESLFGPPDACVDERGRATIECVCANGLDDDGDGAFDFDGGDFAAANGGPSPANGTSDPGCGSLEDSSELSACANGIDDDDDGFVDLADSGCQDSADNTE